VTPTATGPTSYRAAAAALAVADGHRAARGRPYLAPLRVIAKDCDEPTAAETVGVVNQFTDGLRSGNINVDRLTVAKSLAGAARHEHGDCGKAFAAYLGEVVGTGPSKAKSEWGGYGGSVSAWDSVHHQDPKRSGQYLPRRHGNDAYQLLSSGQVTSMVERFDPPVAATLALKQIIHDLMPGNVHAAYTLATGQCRQVIYLGSQLGGLLHNSSLGAFVELSSGGGVGRTPYDDLRVSRARITPLGAVGGQPCT
jgi:hypothetical protein